jgi:predicted PurR-regulated permease PerM
LHPLWFAAAEDAAMLSKAEHRDFAMRALTAAALVVLVVASAMFLVHLLDVLLLAFAGILLAIAIDGLVRLILRYLPIARGWALLIAFAIILLLIAAAALVIVPQTAAQIPQLMEQLPQAAREVGNFFRQLPGAEAAIEGGNNENGGAFSNENIMARVGGVFSTAFGAIGSIALILILACYIVLSPGMYADHFVHLIPRERRGRVREVLATQGRALRLWLVSRFISMIFVGVVTAIGLSLLGVPMALTLGLLAGLLTFIPYLGPIIAAVPTALVALLVDVQLAVIAVLFYFAVETIEGNVVTPLAAKHVVHLPPAYTVLIQVAGGVAAGIPGVILATPITVAAAVAVQMLYMEDTLGDEVEVLGGEINGDA